jgi:hypothetical protein
MRNAVRKKVNYFFETGLSGSIVFFSNYFLAMMATGKIAT